MQTEYRALKLQPEVLNQGQSRRGDQFQQEQAFLAMKNPREGDITAVEMPIVVRALKGRAEFTPEMTDNRNRRKRIAVD